MHSRIFQLVSEPINEDDYATEADFLDGFVGSIADYVAEVDDRAEDIRWFASYVEQYGGEYNPDEESITFPEGFALDYFRDRLEEVKCMVNNLTLEQFVTDTLCAYELRRLIEDEFGFYVYIDNYYETLDDFVRNLQGEQKYYIGAVLDYHF